MKPFVAAILLRLSWLDALRDDAQSDPPDAQLRQPTERLCRKRSAVVAADARGEAKLAEGTLEVWSR